MNNGLDDNGHLTHCLVIGGVLGTRKMNDYLDRLSCAQYNRAQGKVIR